VIGFLTFLQTPWHDYLLLGALALLFVLAGVGAVACVVWLRRSWTGRLAEPAGVPASPEMPAHAVPAGEHDRIDDVPASERLAFAVLVDRRRRRPAEPADTDPDATARW
jgi:hypothetical protein